ncbi:MAG: YncE family protein [Tannerellaceae bacterium]|jgi:YVTN family beta-propeller protein|nr:YncE family protein [Tannerellaceae bacterium]
MKKNDLLTAICLSLFIAFTSCEKENDPAPEPEPTLPQTTGFFVLNRGGWNANNASLAYYNLLEGVMIPDLYKTVNGKGLGDSAEQILMYGSKIYITVTVSNRLVVLDETGRELKSIEPKDGETPLSPRRMVADGGKVYVSYYDGHRVAVLDTTSLSIGQTVGVGRYPEHLAIAGGKLYVANSGGLDYPVYNNTVSVVNLNTLEVTNEITVAINPVRLLTDSQGDVYVISIGNYGDVKSTLQRIDAGTGQVTEMGRGSLFTLANDKLYVVHAAYGDPQITFKTYDVLTETVEQESFITDGTTFTAISALAVDPLSGKIYVADAENYVSTGTLYIFSPEGKKETSMDTGGTDPSDILFLVQ